MKIPEIIRVQTEHAPGSLAKALTVLGEAGLTVEGLHPVARNHLHSIWEITTEIREDQDIQPLLDKLDELPTARVLGRSDRVFEEHKGGKIRTVSTRRIDSLEMLRDLYTPGVARVCLAIRDDPARASELTAIHNTVAIVTNGTAILGLGDIGPVAGAPVMEGKAALFAELAGLSGVPILIDSHDPDVIVDTVAAIAPSFGAVQLEDIRAPECFDIESRLIERLDIPVMHDDQHGTAVVVLAAIIGASKRMGIDIASSCVGQIGLGAAGLGIAKLLNAFGASCVMGADKSEDALRRLEAMGGKGAELGEVMRTADIVVATTGVPGLIKPEMVRDGQVILALSNPEPEIDPHAALRAGACFATDGRVVNNVLGFPGVFRGALDAGAKRITLEMLVAAAQTLADIATGESLTPDPLDRGVHARVAQAVRRAASA